MEREDVFLSLSKLEDSLKGLESAKDMVVNTISSYNIVSEKIESYVDLLNPISQNVADLITVINNNNEVFTKETSIQLQSAIDSFSTSVDEIKSAINEMPEDLKRELSSIEQNFSDNLNECCGKMNSRCENMSSEYKKHIDKLQNSFVIQSTDSIKVFRNSMVSVEQLLAKEIEGLHDGFNSQCERILSELSNATHLYVDQTDKSLRSYKETTDYIEQTYSNNLGLFFEKVDSHCKNLISELNGSVDGVCSSFATQSADLVRANKDASVSIKQTFSEEIGEMQKDFNIQCERLTSELKVVTHAFVAQSNESIKRYKDAIDLSLQTFFKNVDVFRDELGVHCDEIISRCNESIDKTVTLFDSKIKESIKIFTATTDKMLQDFGKINDTIKNGLSENRDVILNVKDYFISVNNEQKNLFQEKMNQLERRNIILQKWIYLLIVLSFISVILRFV